MTIARLLTLGTLLLGLVAPVARGAEFRVETRIFLEGETAAKSTNTTFFMAGKVYDFREQPREITLIDPIRGRVVLIDPSRKVTCEFQIEAIRGFAERVQAWAAGKSDPVLRFASAPTFEQSTDETTKQLVFKSRSLTYRIKTLAAPSSEAARQYREFSDLSSCLKAITNPGGLPPQARLAINVEIEKQNVLPEEVQLSIDAKRFGKPIVLRSEHRIHWRLIDKDRARIAEAAEFLVSFPVISAQEYLAGAAAPAE